MKKWFSLVDVAVVSIITMAVGAGLGGLAVGSISHSKFDKDRRSYRDRIDALVAENDALSAPCPTLKDQAKKKGRKWLRSTLK